MSRVNLHRDPYIRACLRELTTSVIFPEKDNITIKGEIIINDYLVCKKSICGPISIKSNVNCSVCMETNCSGFTWFREEIETQLCANCIFECVLQYQGKQMWIDKNGDPISNLKKDIDEKFNKLRDELRDEICDELRDKIRDELRKK